MTALTPVQALHALAGEHGVATLYRDWRGQPVEVGDDTVRAVLAAMDVDASTPEAVQESLAAERRRRRQRTIAPTVVARQGQRTEVPVRVAPGSAAGAEIRLADGGVVALNLEHGEPVQRQLVLPPDLPQGEHRLALTTGAAADLAHLFVVPARVRSADHLARTWGWMVQLTPCARRAAGASATSAACASWWPGPHRRTAPTSCSSTPCTLPRRAQGVQLHHPPPGAREVVGGAHARRHDEEVREVRGGARGQRQSVLALRQIRRQHELALDRLAVLQVQRHHAAVGEADLRARGGAGRNPHRHLRALPLARDHGGRDGALPAPAPLRRQ